MGLIQLLIEIGSQSPTGPLLHGIGDGQIGEKWIMRSSQGLWRLQISGRSQGSSRSQNTCTDRALDSPLTLNVRGRKRARLTGASIARFRSILPRVSQKAQQRSFLQLES